MIVSFPNTCTAKMTNKNVTVKKIGGRVAIWSETEKKQRMKENDDWLAKSKNIL